MKNNTNEVLLLFSLKVIFALICTVLVSWVLFSWGEVAHKQVDHDYEYSEHNFFILLLDKNEEV